jgi:DNA-binding transcriptional ArsR family regulator
MDLGNLASAVVPSLDAHVLAVLAGTTRQLTGREVERLARQGSHRGVQRVLARLSEQGLVDVIEAGSALLYSLNRDHVAADIVISLSSLREVLMDRMRAEAAEWSIPPVSLSMFGSAARTDGTTASDIDLLLIRPSGVTDDDPVWFAQTANLGERIHRWTGNHASFLEVTPGQLRAMLDRAEPVAESLRQDAIDVAGEPIRALLGRSA